MFHINFAHGIVCLWLRWSRRKYGALLWFGGSERREYLWKCTHQITHSRNKKRWELARCVWVLLQFYTRTRAISRRGVIVGFHFLPGLMAHFLVVAPSSFHLTASQSLLAFNELFSLISCTSRQVNQMTYSQQLISVHDKNEKSLFWFFFQIRIIQTLEVCLCKNMMSEVILLNIYKYKVKYCKY